MGLSIQLRIAAIFEILVVSFVGFLLPLILTSRNYDKKDNDDLSANNYDFTQYNFLESHQFRLAKSYSAGIILGVGLMHLLADALKDMGSVNEYNVPVALLCAGIVLTLALEQLSMFSLSGMEMVQPQKVNNEIEFTPGIELTPAHSHSNEMLEPATVHERNELLKPESNSKKALVKAIVLESSVAIHSIIIGFDLGNLGSEADVSTIRVLMIALAFHQFFEGISLGTAISETILSKAWKAVFAVTFAFTLPAGIIIGILTQINTTGVYVKGCANSIAAGSLVYSALVEMVAEDFSEEALKDKHSWKFQMVLAFALGCTTMAVLAIWT